MKKGILFIITCCSFFMGQAQEETRSGSDTSKYKPVKYPEGYTANLDEVYVKIGDWNGRMDIYFQQSSAQPTPLIINIHGGGWKNGVKESQGGFNPFFKAGFAVANVEYRMTPQAKAPAAIEDVRCALIYMIKNAKQFNIDINKIVVMGGSAGGHLALMAGLLGNNHAFDNNCKGSEKIKVAAIIDKYGIADVWDWAYGLHGPEIKKSNSAKDWMGDKKNDEAFAKSVSPVSYINKNSPPTLIIHGNADSTVPYKQSVELHKQLEKAGVKTELITVEGGGHGKFPKEKNTELSEAILRFLNELPPFKK